MAYTWCLYAYNVGAHIRTLGTRMNGGEGLDDVNRVYKYL